MHLKEIFVIKSVIIYINISLLQLSESVIFSYRIWQHVQRLIGHVISLPKRKQMRGIWCQHSLQCIKCTWISAVVLIINERRRIQGSNDSIEESSERHSRRIKQFVSRCWAYWHLYGRLKHWCWRLFFSIILLVCFLCMLSFSSYYFNFI